MSSSQNSYVSYRCKDDGNFIKEYYNDATCKTKKSSDLAYSKGCQNGIVYTCLNKNIPTTAPTAAPTPPAPIPPPPLLPVMSAFNIFYRAYGNDDCTGTILYTVGAVKNVCVANGKGSYKFTCDNNIPTRNEYNSSTTCSGKASLWQALSTTCSAPLR